MPVREWSAVTVMITPDPFGNHAPGRQSCGQEVRREYVVTARENCSASSSASGTPTILAFGIPTALNEMSTRPAVSITDCRCVVHSLLVESVNLRRLCGSAGGNDVLGDCLDRLPGRAR